MFEATLVKRLLSVAFLSAARSDRYEENSPERAANECGHEVPYYTHYTSQDIAGNAYILMFKVFDRTQHSRHTHPVVPVMCKNDQYWHPVGSLSVGRHALKITCDSDGKVSQIVPRDMDKDQRGSNSIVLPVRYFDMTKDRNIPRLVMDTGESSAESQLPRLCKTQDSCDAVSGQVLSPLDVGKGYLFDPRLFKGEYTINRCGPGWPETTKCNEKSELVERLGGTLTDPDSLLHSWNEKVSPFLRPVVNIWRFLHVVEDSRGAFPKCVAWCTMVGCVKYKEKCVNSKGGCVKYKEKPAKKCHACHKESESWKAYKCQKEIDEFADKVTSAFDAYDCTDEEREKYSYLPEAFGT